MLPCRVWKKKHLLRTGRSAPSLCSGLSLSCLSACGVLSKLPLLFLAFLQVSAKTLLRTPPLPPPAQVQWRKSNSSLVCQPASLLASHLPCRGNTKEVAAIMATSFRTPVLRVSLYMHRHSPVRQQKFPATQRLILQARLKPCSLRRPLLAPSKPQ